MTDIQPKSLNTQDFDSFHVFSLLFLTIFKNGGGSQFDWIFYVRYLFLSDPIFIVFCYLKAGGESSCDSIRIL